jgi:predicted amidophosphoribosyltransferase
MSTTSFVTSPRRRVSAKRVTIGPSWRSSFYSGPTVVAIRRYPLGPPPGFPNCPSCVYLSAGSSVQCVDCASKAITAVAASSCRVCDQEVAPGKSCSNWLCRQPTRNITQIRAIAVHTGPLRRKILSLKYDGRTGWAIIFGRLLYGYVKQAIEPDAHALIVANPTYRGEGSRAVVDHTELVVESAEKEDIFDEWDWDVGAPRVLRKVGPTPPSASSGLMGKRESADALQSVLKLADPEAIRDRRVIVYDDVCTTGLQLDAVAGFLLRNGAASVDAIVLARAPWVF